MSPSPFREWGNALLVLGAVVAVFAVAFAVAQSILASSGPKTYGFADTAVGAGSLAAVMGFVGGGLRIFDYFAIARPRRLRAQLRTR
jgi:hypothetical protein